MARVELRDPDHQPRFFVLVRRRNGRFVEVWRESFETRSAAEIAIEGTPQSTMRHEIVEAQTHLEAVLLSEELTPPPDVVEKMVASGALPESWLIP